MIELEPLYNDPAFAQLYDAQSSRSPVFEFCARAAENAQNVLDIGCGTGALATALAGGREVTGLDPARAMLNIARSRRGGDLVKWVECDARTMDLDQRFDLIVMTGNVFQVFLTNADQAAVLAGIARHISPDGRFAFDTRNPAGVDWHLWTPAGSRRVFDDPMLGEIERVTDHIYHPSTGVAAYTQKYRIMATSEARQATSRIRFTPKANLDHRLAEAGLNVLHCYQDWKETPWDPHAQNLVFFGGLA